MAVAESLMGDALEYADPQWLRTVVAGLRLMVQMISLLLGCLVFALVGGLAAIVLAPIIAPTSLLLGFLASGLGAVMIFALVAFPVGLWRFTTVEPREAIDARRLRTGSAARLFFAIAIVLIPLSRLIRRYVIVPGDVLIIAAGLAALGGVITLLLRVRWLGRRIPGRNDEAKARSELRGWVITAALLGLGYLLRFVTGVPAEARGILFATGMVLGFLMSLSLISYLARFRRALEEVARRAHARREATASPTSDGATTASPPGSPL